MPKLLHACPLSSLLIVYCFDPLPILHGFHSTSSEIVIRARIIFTLTSLHVFERDPAPQGKQLASTQFSNPLLKNICITWLHAILLSDGCSNPGLTRTAHLKPGRLPAYSRGLSHQALLRRCLTLPHDAPYHH